MASMSSSEEDLSCPMCRDILKDPVILTCSHSICKCCLKTFWETTRGSKECPVCKKTISLDPPCNLHLKNLCETFSKQRSENRQLCNLHQSELKLYCEDDKQLVCLVCRDSKLHQEHKFSPVKETAQECKDTLKTLLKPLKDKLEIFNDVKLTCDETAPHIKNYKTMVERAQCTLQDPEKLSGALINVAKYLGNLKFTVWEKMKDLVQYTPVILDPNTAHSHLILSEDLTALSDSGQRRALPDNPERLGPWESVLGSEGINSGTHCWDVKFSGNVLWDVGLKPESANRSTVESRWSGSWFLNNCNGEYKAHSPDTEEGIAITMQQEPKRIRVQLNWDRGELSFTDPDNDTHLHTFTHKFTERVFPYFYAFLCSLKILPVKPVVMVEQLS
ncbi:nuclear factor 7, ovary-like isoform X2 [Engraulis encrasicolus]|uniref:nuclear factor 7, ovary-like isoform X2 n=1 Tax=Engraulis encrasicolus TaxID=184585 RepID=UPI002FD3A5FE